jgi:hypothetical protein
VNLRETRKARWTEALTADKMKKCIWVRTEVVAQIEFLEWTETDHLRHARFVGLRDDKDAREVVKEYSDEFDLKESFTSSDQLQSPNTNIAEFAEHTFNDNSGRIKTQNEFHNGSQRIHDSSLKGRNGPGLLVQG